MTRNTLFTNTVSMFSYSTTTENNETHSTTTRFSHYTITTMFRQRVDGKYHISSGRNVGSNGPSTGTN